MASTAALDLHQCSPELIAFATDEACRDATEVSAFLATAGVTPSPGATYGVPKEILLDLGAVIRLRRWEAAGLNVHRELGLPTALAALDLVIQTLMAAANTQTPLASLGAGRLARTVFEVAVTHLSWGARSILGTDILLDTSDDDKLVEAMAQFLWMNRSTTEGERTP